MDGCLPHQPLMAISRMTLSYTLCLPLMLAMATTLPATTVAQFCDDGWSGYRDSCYKAYTHKAYTYEEARDKCTAVGAFLASAADQEENNFLANMQEGNVWIGLTKEWMTCRSESLSCYRQGWVWEDGTTVNSDMWSDGQPKSRFIACAFLTKSAGKARWVGEGCSVKHPYVCKKTLEYRVRIQVDNDVYDMYSSSGRISTGNAYNTHNVHVAKASNYVAIYACACYSGTGPYGIMLSINGRTIDERQMRCKDVGHLSAIDRAYPGWKTLNYDDSWWPLAGLSIRTKPNSKHKISGARVLWAKNSTSRMIICRVNFLKL